MSATTHGAGNASIPIDRPPSTRTPSTNYRPHLLDLGPAGVVCPAGLLPSGGRGVSSVSAADLSANRRRVVASSCAEGLGSAGGSSTMRSEPKIRPSSSRTPRNPVRARPRNLVRVCRPPARQVPGSAGLPELPSLALVSALIVALCRTSPGCSVWGYAVVPPWAGLPYGGCALSLGGRLAHPRPSPMASLALRPACSPSSRGAMAGSPRVRSPVRS